MKMTPIRVCKNAVEASFVKAKLKNEGVECFLTNEDTTTLLPHLFMSDNSGVQVFIDEKDLDRAEEILKETAENK